MDFWGEKLFLFALIHHNFLIWPIQNLIFCWQVVVASKQFEYLLLLYNVLVIHHQEVKKEWQTDQHLYYCLHQIIIMGSKSP